MHRLPIFPMLWALLVAQAAGSSTTVIPNAIQTGTSVAQFVSSTSGLDGPKIQSNNATSFDWWYFDAVSEDSLSSVVIVFYLSTDLGFPFLLPGSAISVDIFVSFDDGTYLFFPLNDLPFTIGEATVVTVGDGSSGVWASTGFKWTGTSNMSQYVVTIDSPALGISGSLTLNSVRTFDFYSPIKDGIIESPQSFETSSDTVPPPQFRSPLGGLFELPSDDEQLFLHFHAYNFLGCPCTLPMWPS